MHSTNRIRLALDAYGGDFGPTVTVSAACDAVMERRDLSIIVVGPEHADSGVFDSLDESEKSRISFIHAEQALESDVGPVAALRKGVSSSMGLAINLLMEEPTGILLMPVRAVSVPHTRTTPRQRGVSRIKG